MGVCFLRDTEKPKEIKLSQNGDLKMINYGYHSNAIYKGCSYSKYVVKTAALKKDKTALNTKHTKNIKSDFSNTNINRPVPVTPNNNNEYITEFIKAISNASNEMQQKSIEPLVDQSKVMQVETLTSTPIMKSTMPKCSRIMPKLLCPCICGGEDGAENMPYNRQNATDSYESIELRTDSDKDLPPLNFDASLMSIIFLQKNLNQHKTPKMYPKIITGIIQNAYKNFIYIFKKS